LTIRPAVRADAEAMARTHWLSANTAYGRDDPLERRLAVAYRIFDEDETYAIYVHPEHWGTGVGQALLERAEIELAKTCTEATLTCMVGNARARRFYERNGWQLGETLVEPHFGGEPTEVCRYSKRLSSS
jgi:GNAT superfamily N-acetyltransferase